MKKTFKLIIAIILLISLSFVITGCGGKEENVANETSEKKLEDTEKSKTFNALNNVFSGEDHIIILQGKTDMGDGEEDVTMAVATKGEDIYIDVNSTSEHATIMYKDGKTYIISHDKRAYKIIQGKGEGIFDEDTIVISKQDLKDIEKQEAIKGKEFIDGTEYEYEEFKDEEENVIDRYYFSNNDLKYIKTIDEEVNEELMKIVKLSSEVEDSLFNIPTGYEIINSDNIE